VPASRKFFVLAFAKSPRALALATTQRDAVHDFISFGNARSLLAHNSTIEFLARSLGDSAARF
jgi:hypothetical protein